MPPENEQDISAVTETGHPFEAPVENVRTNALHLTLVWSADEPSRVGETADISDSCVLGRGPPRQSDEYSRILLARSRPPRPAEGAPLESARISRTHLYFEPLGTGRARVRNVGRGPLLHNGVHVGQTVIKPGDTLLVNHAAVFLVEWRPVTVPWLRPDPPDLGFSFGAADAHGIVGETPAVWHLRESIQFAAAANRHVLLLGESGVGKELAARAVHALSERGDRALVARNAATFPESLIDAELFGNAKNYPNYGSPERVGLIGEADGSNFFLDEIGELPSEQQTHLLRVLDADGEYQRLGESRMRTSNFRLFAATNRPVSSLKDDLCARFAVRITVPSLNERRADVPHLVRNLLSAALASTPENCERYFSQSGQPQVAPSLLDALVRHSYAHHVRELERLLWMSMSSSRGKYMELTEEVKKELKRSRRPKAARRVKREAKGASSSSNTPTPAEIAEAIAAAGGSRTEAARLLGLKSRYALYRLLKKT